MSGFDVFNTATLFFEKYVSQHLTLIRNYFAPKYHKIPCQFIVCQGLFQKSNSNASISETQKNDARRCLSSTSDDPRHATYDRNR